MKLFLLTRFSFKKYVAEEMLHYFNTRHSKKQRRQDEQGRAPFKERNPHGIKHPETLEGMGQDIHIKAVIALIENFSATLTSVYATKSRRVLDYFL